MLAQEDRIGCKVTVEFGLGLRGFHSSFDFVFCQRIEKSKPLTSDQSKFTGPLLGFGVSALLETCTLQLPPPPFLVGWAEGDLVRKVSIIQVKFGVPMGLPVLP